MGSVLTLYPRPAVMGQKWGKPCAKQCHSVPIMHKCMRTKWSLYPCKYGGPGPKGRITPTQSEYVNSGILAWRKPAGKNDVEASPHHHRSNNHLQRCIGDQTRDNRTARRDRSLVFGIDQLTPKAIEKLFPPCS